MPNINLIDTHAHLDMEEFDHDREEVIARALATGVRNIITVGTDVNSSRKALTLAEKYPQTYAVVGAHPHEADRITWQDISHLREIARHPRVVAIGETGLDFYRNYARAEAQKRIFTWQLDIAADLRLPVIIHTRQAIPQTVEILKDWVKQRHTPAYQPQGVIHCFTGDIQTAKQFLDLDFYISFAGFVTYPNSKSLAVVKTVPRDKILLETDCPFLTPQKFRGKRNEPSYVALTAETIATALDMPLEALGEQTTGNARTLFKF
jgi:TatD DNase family protein